MFCSTAAAAAATPVPVRVASMAIKDTAFKTIANPQRTWRSAVGSLLARAAAAVTRRSSMQTPTTPANPVGVLWTVLTQCVAPAEQRLHAHCGCTGDIPAALVKIEVRFRYNKRANASILGPLATNYPALVRSLKALMISYNDYDESGAALGAFAALATRLQELTFNWCGLTSVQGLEGRCEYLRKVDLRGCIHLTSIDALANRVYLEGVDASETAITSIEPLRSCPNLTMVDLRGCWQLSSIGALADHQRLREVDASFTGIDSIEPLRSCPNLTKVDLFYCVNLTEVHLIGCNQLPADVSLPATVTVIRR